ncbi:hypothetical protein HYPSUDRAFT_209283 [Hypholoma sublateritium FD-334 SS-4]|uniref:Uncharacterized protein n=1 Tax=Hypholoma sublateritium (strain FD-334 SS-4) TaxID=945553 RepID=A0A0D2N3C5_HYPSF|nr:hypothetical protein HYPSUDRAFT_209283 [Hypholoma sublateritium FD-334 SS-4]
MSSQAPSKAPAGSAAQTHQSTVGCGTNSPPLEASCSGRPMGLADIDGTIDAGFVPDREQRKEYFNHAEKARAPQGERYVGQSMADEMDKRT